MPSSIDLKIRMCLGLSRVNVIGAKITCQGSLSYLILYYILLRREEDCLTEKVSEAVSISSNPLFWFMFVFSLSCSGRLVTCRFLNNEFQLISFGILLNSTGGER